MKPYRILIAEDDPALLSSLRIRLSAEGYTVHCARDGYQAVSLARQHLPDMLILDVHMPAGDGFSVEDRVRELPTLERIPVIYITGDRSQGLMDRAQWRGVQMLLRKPFNTIELLEIVRFGLELDERHVAPSAEIAEPSTL